MGEQPNLELLKLVGERLHGIRWQVPLAHDLSISDRALRYWLSGASPIPQDIQARLADVVRSRRDELDQLLAAVEEWSGRGAR